MIVQARREKAQLIKELFAAFFVRFAHSTE